MKNMQNRHDKISELQSMTYDEIIDDIQQVELLPSVLIMSGGIDTVTLLHYLHSFEIPIQVLTFDYGQLAQNEIEMAKYHCQKLKVPHLIMKIGEDELAGNLKNNEHIFSCPDTLVGSRNLMFLSIAITYALEHGYSRVYYGSIGFNDPTYLDCSPEFIHSLNITALQGDVREVQVRAPLITYSKEDVVELALRMGVEIEKSWTCYDNHDLQCGRCAGCNSRYESEQKLLKKYKDYAQKLEHSLDCYERTHECTQQVNNEDVVEE